MKRSLARKLIIAFALHIVAGFCLLALERSGYLQPAIDSILYGDMTLSPGQRNNLLVGFLLAGDYEALEREFESHRQAFRQDVAAEARYYRLFNDAAVPNRGAQPLLNRWIEERPQSAYARLVRAQHFYERAVNARGTDYYSEVPVLRRLAFRWLLRRANADLDDALALDANLHKAYSLRMSMGKVQGSRAAIQLAKSEALRISPYSEVPRWIHLFASTPEWGGSEVGMREIVAEARSNVKHNGALQAIEAGFLAWQAEQQERAQDSCAAYDKYAESIAVYPTTRGRMGLARAAFCRQQNDVALEYVDEVLRLDPANLSALRLGYRIHVQNEDFGAAETIAERAVYCCSLEPEAWYMRGSMHLHFQRYESAHLAFLAALALEPSEPYYTAYERLAREMRQSPDRVTTLTIANQNGETIETAQYKEGRRNGETRTYRGGHLYHVITYADGVRHGPARSYYAESDRIKQESYYNRGEREGELLEYSREGRLTARYLYRNGKPDGEARRYYPDGSVRVVQQWRSGELQGEERVFAPDGSLRQVSVFRDGKIDGAQRVFSADGAVVAEWRYEAGERREESPGYLDARTSELGEYRFTLTTDFLDNGVGMSDRDSFVMGSDWIRFRVDWQDVDDSERTWVVQLVDAAGVIAAEYRHSGVARNGTAYIWTEIFPNELQHAAGQWWAVHRVDGNEISRKAFHVIASGQAHAAAAK